jgi:N-acetylneuraminate synthase
MNTVALKNGRMIGPGQPCFIIAEIGINHNGSLDLALKMIDEAKKAGCDAVKFQKRTPEICTPKDQWDKMRDTPWGNMRYIDYRYKVEFGEVEYATIDTFCKEHDIVWFASCWDEPSVDFIEKFDPLLYKMASASLTDIPLLQKTQNTGKPLMISTGMSTMDEIVAATKVLSMKDLMIAHSTSSYPCPPYELNLQMIHTLQNMYPETPIGYSGHETGLATTVAAVALGASFVERHFTTDRAMWGSDQAASVEPGGMARLVKDIRDVETAMGDGVKKVYDSEMTARQRLRKVYSETENSK